MIRLTFACSNDFCRLSREECDERRPSGDRSCDRPPTGGKQTGSKGSYHCQEDSKQYDNARSDSSGVYSETDLDDSVLSISQLETQQRYYDDEDYSAEQYKQLPRSSLLKHQNPYCNQALRPSYGGTADDAPSNRVSLSSKTLLNSRGQASQCPRSDEVPTDELTSLYTYEYDNRGGQQPRYLPPAHHTPTGPATLGSHTFYGQLCSDLSSSIQKPGPYVEKSQRQHNIQSQVQQAQEYRKQQKEYQIQQLQKSQPKLQPKSGPVRPLTSQWKPQDTPQQQKSANDLVCSTALVPMVAKTVKNLPKWALEGTTFQGEDASEALRQGQAEWKRKLEESKGDMLVDLSVTRKEASIKLAKGKSGCFSRKGGFKRR